MLELVLKLDYKHVEALGGVRDIDGLKLAVDGEFLWVRGIMYSEDMDLRIRQLPVLNTYLTDEKEFLFIPGHITPIDKLPSLNWVPVTSFLPVELPISSMPGNTAFKIPFQLIAAKEEREGHALLTSLPFWKQYAETVSVIRLEALRFAVSENDEVLIIGSPLPAIPGREFWISEDLLIPSGYVPEASIGVKIFADQFNKGRHCYLLLAADGSWQLIQKNYFMPAKRSGIRLSGVTH